MKIHFDRSHFNNIGLVSFLMNYPTPEATLYEKCDMISYGKGTLSSVI